MQKFLLIFPIIMCSCTSTRYHINVKTQSVPQDELPETSMCEIRYFNKDANPKSIESREYNRQIEKILTDNGIQITDSKKANCTIGVAYAIEGPYKETNAAPIIGITGTSSSTSYTNGSISVYGNTAYGSAMTQTYNIPQYGVTGYRYYDTYYYVRWLALAAINKNGEELWNANISSTGSTNDMRKIFPLLSYVAGDAIMTNKDTSVVISSTKAKEITEFMTNTKELY